MNDSHLVLVNVVRRTHALLPINLPLARHPSRSQPASPAQRPTGRKLEPQRGCAVRKRDRSRRAPRDNVVLRARAVHKTRRISARGGLPLISAGAGWQQADGRASAECNDA